MKLGYFLGLLGVQLVACDLQKDTTQSVGDSGGGESTGAGGTTGSAGSDCSAGGSSDDGVVTDPMMALLESVWPNVVEPSMVRVEEEASRLKAAVDVWQLDSTSTAARANAKDAWVDTMRAWQVMEAMQIGPAAGPSWMVIGGKEIADDVYSWPIMNRCRVDQSTLEFDGSDFFGGVRLNDYGLDALETVLFSSPQENNCPDMANINRDGTWAALGAEGVVQARADFSVGLVSKLQADLLRLRTAWETDFATQLSTAGVGSARFDTATKALNSVFNGLFYLETIVKDKKLGWPLEITCPSDDCLDDIETTMAGRSNEWIIANLEGFRALYTGGGVYGIHDLLISIGEEGLANNMLSELAGADAAAAAVPSALDEAVRSDVVPVANLHARVKRVTDLLKIDVATVLAMELPSESAGEGDTD